jgi:D-glycero-alpha-D-manno-heptose-7-phosphate kinase
MIQTTSPTRVDLAGGTLDCWPLHVFVGDCVTVNLSIDVMTGCELEFLNGSQIQIEVTDLNYSREFAGLEQFLTSSDPELKLVQAVIKVYQPKKGFRLKTFSQSPVGGGLGGSSSLCISLIKAFSQAAGVQLKVYETVEMAHNIEAEVIHAPTGTQDYFPALAPGLNLIRYSARGARLEPLDFDQDLFSSRLMLVYTGKAHHSGINNWQVLKDVIDGKKEPLRALKKIAQISSKMAVACQNKDWGMIPELFHQEFEARVELSAGFSSPEIEVLRRLVLQYGGDAVKICGAGGGGCVLVWADPLKHEALGRECQKNGFRPIKFRAVRQREPVLL